ncbi:DNA-binding CsgD family transcriptional regulator/sugar-specific transcriptional regulator TrmB [Streptacidiphilus sp. MAP12-16]|jgi:DNA-binding CsgD family transcriptional regulator/sugar-specific transcriptional regulator TrmB|uniref:helix-turn-helix transcriptional regulator n=1 Tax=Streptacidiphilus sp. MAP12-16 TaxID=3156300 RepID=UPI003517D58E
MLETLGLSTTAEAVYQAMLDHPGLGVADLAQTLGIGQTQIHIALDDLADLMLVRASRDRPGQWRAVQPQVGLADMLLRQEADLAARQAQLAASRAAVTRLVADRADTHDTGATHGERLLGMDAIQSRLETMGRTVTTDCLGVMPGGAQRPEDLAAGRPLNAQALARGVRIRSLYQDSVRNDPSTTAHANWLMENGGEVRTAPVVPQRLIITDLTHALVPIDPADSRKGALYVTEPGLVTALAHLFEQAWATAVPLGATRTHDPDTGLTETERELLRLLGSGLTDETAAHRLGISLRTVRRQMASIMERLNATSRFEAGLKAAQRGWL